MTLGHERVQVRKTRCAHEGSVCDQPVVSSEVLSSPNAGKDARSIKKASVSIGTKGSVSEICLQDSERAAIRDAGADTDQ